MKTAAAQRQNRGFCSGANARCKIRSRPRAETGLSAYFGRGGWQMSLFFCRNAHGVGRADLSDAAGRFGPEMVPGFVHYFSESYFSTAP